VRRYYEQAPPRRIPVKRQVATVFGGQWLTIRLVAGEETSEGTSAEFNLRSRHDRASQGARQRDGIVLCVSGHNETE
jgi:hypothetical protein